MEYMNDFYPESKFGGFTDIDGTIAFYSRVNALVDDSSVMLDVGCGRGAFDDDPIQFRRQLRIFTGRCRKVIGIDVDESAEVNPFIDDFHLLNDRSWPVADNSVDVSICDSVLEHVKDPRAFFTEWQRVIKPGGYICIRAPNLISYVVLISKLIPDNFHAAIAEKVQEEERQEEDVFPVYYRCNTIYKIRKMLDEHGFEHCVYGYGAEPGYLSFSHFSYLLGVIHQKLSPSFIKPTIFAWGRKL